MGHIVPASQGGIVVVQIPDPIAGADFDYQIPIRTRLRLTSIAWLYTADANVADREPKIEIYHGVNLVGSYGTYRVITANDVTVVCFGAAVFTTVVISEQLVQGGFPVQLLLNDQMHISSNTYNIAATDALTDIYLIGEEWIEPLL